MASDRPSPSPAVPVTMWFDPVCPWAWMTSRWIDEVARQRPLDVTWRVMSLSVLNEGRDVPPGYADMLDRSWGPVRVLTAVRVAHGRDALKPLYDAMGERIHPGGRDDYEDVVRESLHDVGLRPTLASAAPRPDADDDIAVALKAEHATAMDLVGADVGTPVVSIGDVAFFGPVVSPAPTGEDALRLFDGVAMAASVDGFFELKRTRDRGPRFA